MGVAPIEAIGGRAAASIVKISAGTWVTHLLCNQVDQLVGEGRVSLRFISADHILDIGHREAIIGIRNKRPEQIGTGG